MAILDNILIIDDNDNDCDQIKHSLVNIHCKFEVASNLEEGDSRVASFEPEIVILDVVIPHSQHSTGSVPFEEILRFIQKRKEKHGVVVLTGFVNQDQLDQAMDAGACDYIDKQRLSNRAYMESRIKKAYALHLSLRVPGDIAEILRNQAHFRASHDTLSAKMRQIGHQMGAVQDQKTELWKKQIYRERDEYWKKRILTCCTAAGWVIYASGKFAFDKWILRKE